MYIGLGAMVAKFVVINWYIKYKNWILIIFKALDNWDVVICAKNILHI